MERTHGGDWAGYMREHGALPLDFSANVSPLGTPERVRAALRASADAAERYPDDACRALCEAIAVREGILPEQVLCGNGASDLIFRAVWAARPKRALLAVPCFGEYEAALETVGCEIVRFPLQDPFRLGEDFLSLVDNNIDITILCNPNNPTGLTIEPELLLRIAARCSETGGRLLVDECFVDFLDEPERHTLRPLLGAQPRLLLVRAFTKLYGLAGVRLGYVLCADSGFLDAMRRSGPPWAVSSAAQEAGLAALHEEDYVREVRALIGAQRPVLADALRTLGLRVVPGEANFLLFQSSRALAEVLRAQGILLRGCGDFMGLDDTWYRAAVRTREDNERLIAALGVFLGAAAPGEEG